MATGPIETHLHRSFNWENAAPGSRMGPRGRSASCGNGLSAQSVRLRSEINRPGFHYDAQHGPFDERPHASRCLFHSQGGGDLLAGKANTQGAQIGA